ncbi:hypothetical protein V5O48_015595 [Marasmius crinis-equi]|uniref:F-box domain-containing protein n=1 Tax=Marasmius crinis-equi TaxID=585013 RepID=A0ABR3EU39_9AGAR
MPSDGEISQSQAILTQEAASTPQSDEESTVLSQRSEMLATREQAYRVPGEVWEMIFSICSTLDRYSFRVECGPGEETQNVHLPALVLSQVCARWRGIMKSSPRLWSSISIEFIHLPFDIVPILELYFVGSKDYPLDIRIIRDSDYVYSLPPPLSKHDLSAWRTLSQHMPRCRNLSFRLAHIDLPEIGGLSFPRLESVCEEAVRYDSGEEKSSWLWQALERSPILTRVSLFEFHHALPLSRLTSLELRCVMAREVGLLLDVLPTCERLEHLSLRGLDDSDMDLVVLRHAEAPSSFRKISISGEDYTPLWEDNLLLSSLLEALSMPSLVCIELRCTGRPPSLLTTAKQSPRLERVHLMLHCPAASQSPSHTLVPFLRSLRNLMHLELTTNPVGHPPYSDEVLVAVLSLLERRPDSSVCFPELKSLSLRLSCVTLDCAVVEKVLQALSDRCSASRTLKEFCLLVNPMLERNELEQIESAMLGPALVQRIRRVEQDYGIIIAIEDIYVASPRWRFLAEALTHQRW